MATRLYLAHSSATGTADVSPAFQASWTNTTSVARRKLSHFKITGDAASTLAFSWTAGEVRLLRQYVSAPLVGGQTISGTIECWGRGWESNADDNASTRFAARIVSRDGSTVQHTLLAVGSHGTGTEFVATGSPGQNRQWCDDAIASYTTQPGDRIVVEIGAADAAGTTPSVTVINGSDFGTDTSESEASANGIPWVEFSSDLVFQDGEGVTNVAERGPDTLFFGYSATAGSALATNLSGNDDDWAHDTTWIYKLNHNAEALQERFAIELACLVDNTDTGYLFENQPDAVPNNAIVVDGAGDMDFYIGGTLRASLDIPGVSATSQIVFVQWSMEANPLTTGATDTRRHDVRLYNADTGAWEGTSFTTGDVTAFDGNDNTTFGARFFDGTDAFSGTLRMVRLSRAHHPVRELERCFLDAAPAPSVDGETRRELAVPDSIPELAGPAHLLAAANIRTNDLRLWGPLVNEVLCGDWAEDSTHTTADPDDAGNEMHGEFLRWAKVPQTCNRVYVRVFVQQNDAAADRLYTRAYVANAPGPLAEVIGGGEYIVQSEEVLRQADDGTGDTGGAWIEFGPFEVVRDGDGYTYFWLGFNSSCPDYRAKAFLVSPMLVSEGAGAFGA